MSKVKQNNIEIGDKVLIEINYNRVTYYPITHIYRDILLKSKQSAGKLIKGGYKIKQLEVNFGYDTGGIQKSQCISQESLIDLLKKSNIGGLTVKQKEGMNLLLEYLGMDLINEKPRFVDDYNYMNSSQYGEFAKDCITETLKLDKSLKWQLCKDCEKYYPLHTNFFRLNSRNNTYRTICNNCIINNGEQHFKHPVYEAKTIEEISNIKQTQIKYSTFDKNYDVLGIYKNYLNSDRVHFPERIRNKNDYKVILRYLGENGQINKDELSYEYLTNDHKLKGISAHLKLHEVYELLFDNHPKEYPWHYKKYKYKSPNDIKDAFRIFNNYLQDKNIVIDDIFNFDYRTHIKNAKLGKNYYNANILDFAMNLYKNKMPAYKFNIISPNYWKVSENRYRALKYLIEEDMKLELEKVPLYLTISSIKSISNTMYNVLKNYYSSLYDWVDEIYPNAFDPKDFDINYMRNEFDSIDEHTIHDILKENFNNVIYNPSQTEHTVKLLGKVPDWFVIAEGGCIIVEYFGLWNKERGMYNARTRDYINRSKDKIEKYKTLKGYRFLYFYPEDMDNNYEGIYGKIKDIKNDKTLDIVI